MKIIKIKKFIVISLQMENLKKVYVLKAEYQIWECAAYLQHYNTLNGMHIMLFVSLPWNVPQFWLCRLSVMLGL